MLMIGLDANLHCLFTMELLPWLAQLTVEPIRLIYCASSGRLEWRLEEESGSDGAGGPI